MKSAPFLALSALLALAACSAEAPVPQASEAASAAASETIAAPVSCSDPVSEGQPTALASPAPAAITAFPAPMLGRWGLVPADCTSQKGDNKGMITVTAREIRFYESVARIDRVKDSSENRVRAALAYDGEGMQ